MNITATVFGGTADNNLSAYDGHVITDDELCVALPARIEGKRPRVEVTNCANGRTVICDICDVGPWETTDPYWLKPEGRPRAERGRDSRGRKTNGAGIDLSPATARAIGLVGKGKCNWRFMESVMTFDELDAGAEAVRLVALKYGVAGWLSPDHLREIAARVIEAHDKVHVEAAARAAEKASTAVAAKAGSEKK